MPGRSPTETPPSRGPARESYGKVIARVAALLVATLALAMVMATGRPKTQTPTKPVTEIVAQALPASARVEPEETEEPSSDPAPTPPLHPAPEPPKLDRAAIAKAEADLDAASRDRARAEARADELSKRLSEATTEAAVSSRVVKTLAFRVRDPSTRIAQANARGGFLKYENEKLKGEIATLAQVPRPKGKVLSNKNPVARPASQDEFHFELRHNRVSYIDLNRLMNLVKADAQLRIRLSDGARVVDARVGPVGPFSLVYSLARGLPAGLEDLMERRGISYELRGWEVVPEFEGRGESFEAARQPISEFGRTINRLSPQKATLTFWIYPDSFLLFRNLRDDLQARGFLVAARPLPDGMAIRGSPSGSLSAGQ